MNILYNNTITSGYLFVFMILLFGKNGIAQTGITGKVTDEETGEEIIAANIVVTKNGVFIQGETTDIDGNYNIRLNEGSYVMEVSYTGYSTKKKTGVLVTQGYITKVNVKLSSGGYDDYGWGEGCLHWGWVIPLIRQDENPSKFETTSEQIRYLPIRNINEIITITPGLSLTK
ncbi:MAG: carboxypeptidase regulatory-like domain-containing protein [Saprospiraceae bacterium]